MLLGAERGGATGGMRGYLGEHFGEGLGSALDESFFHNSGLVPMLGRAAGGHLAIRNLHKDAPQKAQLLEEIQNKTKEAVLAHYKVAFLGPAMKAVSTVGAATMRGAQGAAKAYQAAPAAGGMMGALRQGATAGAKGFQRGGGVEAAKPLAAGAAVLGGGAYTVGRGFGAGQRDAQPAQYR